jgi:hypothetical protein
MKTQQQLMESARRKIAEKNEFTNWLMKQKNQPTKEELLILQEKRPGLWGSYKIKQ